MKFYYGLEMLEIVNFFEFEDCFDCLNMRFLKELVFIRNIDLKLCIFWNDLRF